MIKQISKLVYNEIIKATKKKGLIILTILLFIFSFATPFSSTALNNLYNYYSKEFSEEQILEDIDYIKSDIEQGYYEFDSAGLAYQELQLEILNYRLENKIPYDYSNWKYRTLSRLSDYREAFENPLTNEEYIEEKQYSFMDEYKSYEDYLQKFENKKKIAINEIALCWYNLENDIPPLSDVSDARAYVQNSFPNFFMLIGVIMICIASGCVSSEFSKGTIRLLLIRPASRTKILISKLLSVFIITIALSFLSTLLLVIGSGICSGFSSFLIPVTSINISGDISSINFFLHLIASSFMTTVSLLCITTISCSLSILTTKSIPAVGLSFLLYFGALPFTLVNLFKGETWLLSSFIPYLNLPMFSGESIGGSLISYSGMALNPVGLVQLVVISALLFAISAFSFSKKDIV